MGGWRAARGVSYCRLPIRSPRIELAPRRRAQALDCPLRPTPVTALIVSNILPKVSVCVITYNQSRYLRACLQSIVEQKTNFEFEVVVGDDCSTDGTADVISEYRDRYPKLIVPIFNTKKIGGTRNYVTSHLRARGEYVAHVDGDDVAAPGKLQRQADYLDSHPEAALVWHAVEQFDDAGEKRELLHPRLADVVDRERITLRDVLRYGSLGAASSIMYRRASAHYLSEIGGDTLDYYFSARLLEGGLAANLEEVLGRYRHNSNVATLSKKESPYFRRSPMRDLYADHLRALYERNPSARDDIFLNSLFNFAVEFRFLRTTALPFLLLALHTVSISGVRQVPTYLRRALWLRAR